MLAKKTRNYDRGLQRPQRKALLPALVGITVAQFADLRFLSASVLRDLCGSVVKFSLGWGPAALRMNPNNDMAHPGLGFALEGKGNLRGALEEFHAAHMLAPKNADYQQNYERLLQQVNSK
jgi:hypothetical protein